MMEIMVMRLTAIPKVFAMSIPMDLLMIEEFVVCKSWVYILIQRKCGSPVLARLPRMVWIISAIPYVLGASRR